MEQNDKIQKIEDQFADAIVNSSLIELNETIIEKAWDLIMQDAPIGEIPVIGTLIKSIKLGAGIKDYFFTKKLLKFLIGINNISQEKREKFKEEMKRQGTYEKVSENLLMLIDKIEDLEKAELIAKLFVKVLDGDLTYEGFRQYSTIVLKAFIDDLKTLKGFGEGETYTGYSKSTLLGLGLLNLSPIKMRREVKSINHEGYSSYDNIVSYIPQNLEEVDFTPHDDFTLRLEVYVNEDGQYLYEILFS